MTCRGIRGAVCVDANGADAILRATRRLLEHVVDANDVRVADVASVIFTATPDLDAAYPARAAREMGWVDTPLLCVQEMAVAGSLSRCIRVLVHWNTDRALDEIQHVYLDAARALRPDLSESRSDNPSSHTSSDKERP
jgi:chorismate mutase